MKKSIRQWIDYVIDIEKEPTRRSNAVELAADRRDAKATNINAYLEQLKRKKRQFSLQEQIIFQDIFKKWMLCDTLVAWFAMLGLLIVVIYHIVAIERLIKYCDMHVVEDCKKELIYERYK